MIIFTNGVFDIFHRGHVALLQFCREIADSQPETSWVFVGMNSDESVRRIKGPHRPVMSEKDRFAVLSSSKFVDQVIIFNEDTPERLMRDICPDIIVKSDQYSMNDVVGHEKYPTILAPHVPGISTTDIVRKVRGNFCE